MKIQGIEMISGPICLRWLTIACFEIRIGNFAIVIDPCIGASKRAPFDASVVEQADMILLSHSHWDHTTDIAELVRRFDCPVLCGELSAPALLRMLDCNPQNIYPMTPELELDFGPAKVKALFARHTNQQKTLSAIDERMKSNPYIQTEYEKACSFFGHLEYRDYLITAADGTKLLFWGSNATPEQIDIVRRLRPDIAMLQFTKQTPEDLVTLVKAGGMKVVIPHHMDLAMAPEEYLPRIHTLEELLRRECPGCLLITPEPLCWYRYGHFVESLRMPEG